MSNSFNKIRMFGPLCVQVLLDRGIRLIRLTPNIAIAINNRDLLFGIKFEWITGTVNLGYAHTEFINRHRERCRQNQEEADKLGINLRQQQLRWNNWY